MKPIVKYETAYNVEIGFSASLVNVKNHPQLGDVPHVRTSQVLSYDPVTGKIETLNTVYVQDFVAT